MRGRCAHSNFIENNNTRLDRNATPVVSFDKCNLEIRQHIYMGSIINDNLSLDTDRNIRA
jgi:hypothetical protein